MANIIKRHFYNHEHYYLDKAKKRVILLPNFFNQLKNKMLWGKFGFKKIGGSLIGNVLKLDKFKSDFAAFCQIAWIGLPILDRKYVDAGMAIEPKVINEIKAYAKKEVETFDPKEYSYDYFADRDEIMGGIPDGYIKETETIIEVKTTGEKNLKKWREFGVPNNYLRQAQLYAYLMPAKNFSIVATFLKEEDYANPEQYPIRKRVVKNWNYKINIAQVEDDIKFAKKWYIDHTKSGISPLYNESNDSDLLKWLECSNKEEWEALKNQWIAEGIIVI